MASKIKVDIEELLDILGQLQNDGFITTELEIDDSELFYDGGELLVSAIDLSVEEVVRYGSIPGVDYDEVWFT